MAAPDYSGVTKDIQGGYDAQRRKAAEQEGANLQGQRDAIARKAAQLGGGPSGAMIKTEQNAADTSAQRLQGANEGIDSAQNQELRGVHMTQLGQQYQTSEREAGQQFTQGQQGRQFAHEDTSQAAGLRGQESLMFGQQAFQAQQAKAAQNFAHKETATAQGIQQGQFDKTFGQNKEQFEANFGLEGQKFAEQTHVDDENIKIAHQMADKKDMMEQFFGNIGAAGHWFNNLGGGGNSGGLLEAAGGMAGGLGALF